MGMLKAIKQHLRTPAKSVLLKEIKQLKEQNEILYCSLRYGNTVPLRANLDGEANWRAARDAYSGHIDRSVHDEFVRIGHILREHLFPAELIQRLSDAFDVVIADPQKAFNPFFESPKLLAAYCDGPLPGPTPDCRRDLRDAERDLPQWREVFNDDFVQLIRSCLGSNFTINSAHAARNSHCPPEFIKVFEPFSDRWHFDDQHSDTVYIFIYLKPVTLDHGPFHVHNLENSRRILQMGYDKSKRRQSIGCGLDPEVYENPPSTKLTGPAGACMITMNSLCLHRAGTPNAGHARDLLYIKLRPSEKLCLDPSGGPGMMSAAKS